MDKLHFINPEYLWGLLLLLIPIIIHLFNFRKTKIVFFTRVDLLKEIKTKKRNFSTLKKRLILLTRLLAVTFFVLATAFPYLSEVDLNDKSSKATFLYLDNSFSLQAKLGNHTLMELAKKDIKKSYNDFNDVSQVYLFSNGGYSRINSENELIIELSKVNFTHERFSSLKVKSRISNIAERELISDFNTIVFSDFKEDLVDEDSLFVDFRITNIPFYVDEIANISIDSLWLKTINISENKFTVGYRLSNYGGNDIELNEVIKFDDKIQQSLTRSIKPKSDSILEIQLKLPNSKKAKGVISIKDGDIWYDNHLFFSVDFSEKSKILFVGDKSSNRMASILNDNFVQLENTSHSGLKNRDLDGFDFLIYTLQNNIKDDEIDLLKSYLSKEKELLLVPSNSIIRSEFNKYLRELKIGKVIGYNSKEIAVTEINYQDDFFDDIFNSTVENFEYPILKNNFIINVPKSVKLLSLENGSPFLLKSNNIYLFTSSIFETKNPFVDNDLALPILYKMASSSFQRRLYENVGENVNVKMSDTKSISVDLGGERVKLNKVSMDEFELPKIMISGNFDLYSKEKLVKTVSYNYRRTESNLRKNIEESTVEGNKYKELKNQSIVVYLWKWCLIFTLVFFIIEMLIISFLKGKK